MELLDQRRGIMKRFRIISRKISLAVDTCHSLCSVQLRNEMLHSLGMCPNMNKCRFTGPNSELSTRRNPDTATYEQKRQDRS